MDESLRQRYLAAMEIPVWLGRTPAQQFPTQGVLPGAGESPSQPELGAELVPPAAPPVLGAEPPSTQGMSWDELAQRVQDCRACAQLVANRTRTVFGVGNRAARLMVIGEAPGVDEDRQGEPFVGRAGQLLNRMLLAMGLARDQVFIANVLKCRPPQNRDPNGEEAAQCEPFLLRQIELVEPAVILSVGRISAQNLLNTETPVGQLRGRIFPFGARKIPLVVTYHPAYLLRSPEQKAKAWDDLQLALRTLRGQNQG